MAADDGKLVLKLLPQKLARLVRASSFSLMKPPRSLCLLFATAGLLCAQPALPGLRAILTATEWQRAGLDRLSPDEIGVIDAALIRRQLAANASAR